MVKLPAGGGAAIDAVSWIESVVPSGRLNTKFTWSPGLGLVAPKAIVTVGGEPAGPVTVAPVSEDVTEFSFNPNGEPATSSATATEVGVGDVITSRPRPPVPSACFRSEITCFKPAWEPVPLRMSSAETTDG